MTKQVNNINGDMRTNTLARVITTGALITVISLLTFTGQQDILAQMVMGGHGDFGNITYGLHELREKATANGTINLEQTIFKAISSKVNTSLTEAMTTAEKSVANSSFALAGFGGEYGGYFAYQILLGTPEMNFYTVLVDPGNGQILATQKISAAELENMHEEHSALVVRNHNNGGIGFPFLIPH
jgi:hypothetical protein